VSAGVGVDEEALDWNSDPGLVSCNVEEGAVRQAMEVSARVGLSFVLGREVGTWSGRRRLRVELGEELQLCRGSWIALRTLNTIAKFRAAEVLTHNDMLALHPVPVLKSCAHETDDDFFRFERPRLS
jgi:hypothetical protein